jgi:hypothetical protein
MVGPKILKHAVGNKI